MTKRHAVTAPSVTVAAVNEIMEAIQEGRAPSTTQARRLDLLRFAEERGSDTPAEALVQFLTLTASDARSALLEYRDHMQASRRLTVATIRRRLETVLLVVRFASERGLINWSPDDVAPHVQPPSPYSNRTHGLIAGLGEVAGTATQRLIAVRDRAIVRLIHDLGMHPAEVADLDISDISDGAPAGRCFLSIKTGGQAALRRVRLPAETLRALEAWLQERGRGPGALFPSFDRARKGSGRLSETSLSQAISKAGARFKLEVTPGSIRADAIGTALERTGGDYKSVAAHFGIADPRTLAQHDRRSVQPSETIAELIAKAIG